MNSWLQQAILKFILPIGALSYFFISQYSTFLLNKFDEETIEQLNLSSNIIASFMSKPIQDGNLSPVADALESISKNSRIAALRVTNMKGQLLG